LLLFIGSIEAIVTGSNAKREILESGGSLGGEGMARAGIILGWIGIGLTIIGICITGVVLVIPLCLVAIGLSSEGWGTYLPMVITFL